MRFDSIGYICGSKEFQRFADHADGIPVILCRGHGVAAYLPGSAEAFYCLFGVLHAADTVPEMVESCLKERVSAEKAEMEASWIWRLSRSVRSRRHQAG